MNYEIILRVVWVCHRNLSKTHNKTNGFDGVRCCINCFKKPTLIKEETQWAPCLKGHQC